MLVGTWGCDLLAETSKSCPRLSTAAASQLIDRYGHALRVSLSCVQLSRHRSIETTMKSFRGKAGDADRKALARMKDVLSSLETKATENKGAEKAFSSSASATT